MNYFNNLIKNDPSGTIFTFFLIFTVFIICLVLAYLVDNKKNKQNLQRILMLERAIKDLIEEFRAFELTFFRSKKGYSGL